MKKIFYALLILLIGLVFSACDTAYDDVATVKDETVGSGTDVGTVKAAPVKLPVNGASPVDETVASGTIAELLDSLRGGIHFRVIATDFSLSEHTKTIIYIYVKSSDEYEKLSKDDQKKVDQAFEKENLTLYPTPFNSIEGRSLREIFDIGVLCGYKQLPNSVYAEKVIIAGHAIDILTGGSNSPPMEIKLTPHRQFTSKCEVPSDF